MHLRFRGDREAVEPVASRDVSFGNVPVDDVVIAQRGDNPVSMARIQIPQGRDVEMVVMIMRKQDHIDRWQIGQGDARRRHPARPGKGEWAGTIGPDRVSEDVQPANLDQQRGVADHGDP